MRVCHVVMAVYLMQVAEPRAFVDDRAFDFQMVRRVRFLAPVNVGTYWNQREKRTKRVSRDMPPKVVEMLADMLKAAFGAGALQLARIENRGETREQIEARQLNEAIEALR